MTTNATTYTLILIMVVNCFILIGTIINQRHLEIRVNENAATSLKNHEMLKENRKVLDRIEVRLFPQVGDE